MIDPHLALLYAILALALTALILSCGYLLRSPRPCAGGEREFTYGPGGALVTDEEIPGVTQCLDDDSARFYGGRHMVGETITPSGARHLAKLLSGTVVEKEAAHD